MGMVGSRIGGKGQGSAAAEGFRVQAKGSGVVWGRAGLSDLVVLVEHVEARHAHVVEPAVADVRLARAHLRAWRTQPRTLSLQKPRAPPEEKRRLFDSGGS